MALEQETLFVLLGLESRMDFTANIKREMIISEAAATAITSDLDTDLFLAVRHLLMQLHAEDAVREENTHRDMPVAERESAKEIPMAKTETAPSPVSTPGTRTVPGDIARIKLEQMVQKTTTPSGSPGYPAHDPYREPIE